MRSQLGACIGQAPPVRQAPTGPLLRTSCGRFLGGCFFSTASPRAAGCQSPVSHACNLNHLMCRTMQDSNDPLADEHPAKAHVRTLFISDVHLGTRTAQAE